MKQNHIKHIRCAPYHPSSNCLVERFNQTLKQSLRASEKDGRSLAHRICDFLLTYRSTPHVTTNRSPASLMFNRELRTRFTLLQPHLAEKVPMKQMKQTEQHDQHTKSRSFQVEQHVMVCDFHPHSPKWIPGQIIHKSGPLTYVVRTQYGQEWKCHVDHIRENIPTPSRQLNSSVIDIIPFTHNESIPTTSSDQPSEIYDSSRCSLPKP